MTESESVALPFGDSPMCFSKLFSRLRQVVLYINIHTKVNPFFQIFLKIYSISVKHWFFGEKLRFPVPFPCAFLDECVIIKQNIRNRIGRWREAFGVFFQTHSKVVVPETFLLYRKLLRFVPVNLWLPYKIFIIKQPVWSLFKIIQVIESQTGLINKENKHESK